MRSFFYALHKGGRAQKSAAPFFLSSGLPLSEEPLSYLSNSTAILFRPKETSLRSGV